jgi:3D-(3,5/4)-trihydroxycyclohexane-1,2-dione acylhydrolase (decyclizing)
LDAARAAEGPFVIVVPIEQQRWLPDGGSWWDVAPAEVSSDSETAAKRSEYVSQRESEQRFYSASGVVATETHGKPGSKQ